MNNGIFSKPSNRCYNNKALVEDSIISTNYANRQEKAMKEEQCILVDENDQCIGHSSKEECHLWTNIEKNGMLHRAFSAFVFNDRNELLLQKRSKHKLTFPEIKMKSEFIQERRHQVP
uniref:Isopentenyl-diphosphate Delta-isomerase n=1 Tax=Romanomermis culicivorax TaxID=13658 RepID=A0A915JJE6_ROMCU